jgi:hypothetical protein
MRARPLFQTAARAEARPAFTLLEMLVLIWAFGIMLVAGTAVLVGAFRMEQTAVASLDRLNVQAALADRFRADVAGAAEAPEQLGDLKADPTCLILRRPDGRHVIYRWQDKRLERSEQAAKETSRQRVAVGPDCTVLEFTRTGAERPLITLRLTESPGAGVPERRKEISAALGGELR